MSAVRTTRSAPVTVLTPTALDDEQIEDLYRIVARGGQRIILDLGRLPHINSMHMGVLASAVARARGTDGVLVLVQPQARSRKVLSVLLKDFCRVFATGEEAGAWLQNRTGAP